MAHVVLSYVWNYETNETKYLFFQFKRITNGFLPNIDTIMTNKIDVIWMSREYVKPEYFFMLPGESF